MDVAVDVVASVDVDVAVAVVVDVTVAGPPENFPRTVVSARERNQGGALMMDFVREAGFGIWPVLAFGLFAIVLAVRHARRPQAEHVPLIAGASIATLLTGALGTVTGLQHAVTYIDHVAAAQRWLFLVGLREALNNLVAAFVLVTLTVILTSLGSFRAARVARLARA